MSFLLQTVCFALGIDIDLISVKPCDNFVGNNNSVTTGSRGSELTCLVRDERVANKDSVY